MNKSCYKCCAVPMCRSTSISTPQKLFINVPKKPEVRKKWLTLARRDPASLTTTSTSHFCEDHFDLQNDMENYIEYTTMGVVSRIKMRPDCLPTKFACQPKRASTSTDVCQPVAAKRQRLSFINESEEEMRAAAFQQSENIDTVLPSQDKDTVHEQQKISKIDKAIQAYISCKYRSKATQTITVTHTKQTSPMKLSTRSVSTSTSPFKISQFKPHMKPTPSSSSTTWNSNDKSDSDVSFYTPSVSNVSKASSDTISFNETEWKRDSIKKSMVEHTVDKIKNRPQFYIGVPRDCYFLVNLIHEQTGITEHKILLCLKKIRLDSKFSELSDEFQISTSYASKIFSQNIPKIAEVMRPFIVKLDKPSIKRCLPIAFRKNYYNVTCIIDCLEIEIQKPSKALNQALTWSEYKKANTIKYLISSTPNGLVNYISRGYGGRISDVCLVENCDFLNYLPTGSRVMADRGFKHIESLLLGVGCRLIRPPSTVSDNKLSKEEVKETKKIASLRIHIERVIRRIREFSFLKPHACINNYLLGRLDDAIVIACGLINLQDSLINK